MFSILEELDEKFKPGIAYRCVPRYSSPRYEYPAEAEMVNAAKEIYDRAYKTFKQRVGMKNVDPWILHLNSRRPEERLSYKRPEIVSSSFINTLFEIERVVSLHSRPLERIAALEARLEEANQRQIAMAVAIIHAGNLEKKLKLLEATNTALLERIVTLEKIL